MIDKTTFWIVLPALAIGTYAIRFSFLGMLGNRPLPTWLTRALRYTAVGVLPALVAPGVLWPVATGGQTDPARLTAAIDDPRRSDRAGAILAIVGAVNVPIIYFSVKWWNTLHQGASVTLGKSPSMATPMLMGMLVMALACWMYCIAVALARVRVIMLERERHAPWARQALEGLA